MIKSVSLQNFEAHENTNVEFGEGLNLIEGFSNAGKSSILRALKMVVDNDWDKDMVRKGYDFCRVRVTTDRGWVEAERGEKINRWKCQENGGEEMLFQKVGLTVPEIATKILGMGSRDRGNGIRELPNFQTQLEKHYMLAEVGEKKSTSNMIAVMMDNAIGLCGVEDIIKDFSSDLLRDRKWINEKQGEITELKSEIIDEMIFNGIEELVSDISRMKNDAEEMDEGINAADALMTKYFSAKKNFEDNEEECKRYSGIEGIYLDLNSMDSLKKKISLFEKAHSLEKRISELSGISEIDINSMESVVNSMKKCEKVRFLVEKSNNIVNSLKPIENLLGIDLNEAEKIIGNSISLQNKINEAGRKLTEARNIWKKRSDSQKEEENYGKELENAEKEFSELKDKLGFCPLCGGALK